jgi:hypothetical protein
MVTGHDEKGRFAPGHKPIISNRVTGNTGGGRPKLLKTEVKDALKLAADAMPDIIARMIERASGRSGCDTKTEQAAAEYLIDRIYGKANQPIDIGAKPKFVDLLDRLRGKTGESTPGNG